MTIQTDGSITGMIPGTGTLTFEGEFDEYPVIGYASIQIAHKCEQGHRCEQCDGLPYDDNGTAQYETQEIAPIILNGGIPEILRRDSYGSRWTISTRPWGAS